VDESVRQQATENVTANARKQLKLTFNGGGGGAGNIIR
jgi:hypothetical protein